MARRNYGQMVRARFGRGLSRYRPRFARVRRFYKSGGGSIIFGLGGVAAGYALPRIIPYQDLAITAIAVLPGVLPASMNRSIPWQARRFASGYVVGSMLRAFVPGVLGVSASSGGINYV